MVFFACVLTFRQIMSQFVSKFMENHPTVSGAFHPTPTKPPKLSIVVESENSAGNSKKDIDTCANISDKKPRLTECMEPEHISIEYRNASLSLKNELTSDSILLTNAAINVPNIIAAETNSTQSEILLMSDSRLSEEQENDFIENVEPVTDEHVITESVKTSQELTTQIAGDSLPLTNELMNIEQSEKMILSEVDDATKEPTTHDSDLSTAQTELISKNDSHSIIEPQNESIRNMVEPVNENVLTESVETSPERTAQIINDSSSALNVSINYDHDGKKILFDVDGATIMDVSTPNIVQCNPNFDSFHIVIDDDSCHESKEDSLNLSRQPIKGIGNDTNNEKVRTPIGKLVFRKVAASDQLEQTRYAVEMIQKNPKKNLSSPQLTMDLSYNAYPLPKSPAIASRAIHNFDRSPRLILHRIESLQDYEKFHGRLQPKKRKSPSRESTNRKDISNRKKQGTNPKVADLTKKILTILNHGSEKDLRKLHTIGAKKSNQIYEYR